ncbi:MAG: hypothetical protein KC912_23200 [Proteobacteria bacterium]|nr:hypothetical protein [Pseudomonadota bacterium]
MLLFLAALAAAAPEDSCELTKADLQAQIAASISAIDDDDVDGHAAIIRDLSERVECLDFVPEPELWGQLLVGIAIVEHASGGDWENPLATAFHISRRVDMLVGNSHPFWQWSPPEPPRSTGEPVPDGVRVYLDGLLITEFQQTRGLHLAQRRTGDGWTSVLLRDEPIPESWLKEVALENARTLFGQAHFTVGGGLAAHRQRPAGSGDFLSQGAGARPGGALRLHGHLGYAVPGGIWWDAGLPSLPNPLHHDWVEAGLFWRFGMVDVQAGAGAQWVLAAYGDDTTDAVSPLAIAGARFAPGPIDVTLRGGFSAKARKLEINLGMQPVGPLRIDLLTSWTSAGWDHADTPLPTANLLVAALVGATWEKSE